MSRFAFLKKFNIRLAASHVISALSLGLSIAQAAESEFRTQFRQAKSEHKFPALVYLVKQNKKIIPAKAALGKFKATAARLGSSFSAQSTGATQEDKDLFSH